MPVLDARQHPTPTKSEHRFLRQRLPDPEQHPSGPPASVQSGRDFSRLFFVSPNKKILKGKHWEALESIQAHVITALKNIPEKAFQGAI